MFERAVNRAVSSDRLRHRVQSTPGSRDIVDRFVAGETLEEELTALRDLHSKGLGGLIESLADHALDREAADASTREWVWVVQQLAEGGLAGAVELSVRPRCVGLGIPDGDAVALDNLASICGAAREAGTRVTLDMEDHTVTEQTLLLAEALRPDFADIGVAVQATLLRTPADLVDLNHEGVRVRLCKGSYAEPASVGHTHRHEIDQAFVDLLKALMEGPAYPMVATHDPRLVAIADELAVRNGRGSDEFEFQMMYGIRPLEQRRLVDLGRQVRVYVPYGSGWYSYFLHRLADRPRNVAFFLRSLTGRR